MEVHNLLHDANRASFPLPCLSIDLEVSKKDNRIRSLAAVHSDLNRSVQWSASRGSLLDGLAEIDALAEGAEFVVGHNIIAFDFPHLQAVNSHMKLLALPVVDTLRLSPLAFPEYPYHHLVKHYQDGALLRGRINDPELDARLTLDVLREQIGKLGRTPANLLTAWHWLSTAGENGAGFDIIFSSLRGMPRPTDEDAIAAVQGRLEHASCATAAADLLGNPALLGWPLAYTLAWLSVAGGNSVMSPWVRHQFPQASEIIRRLRDTPCTDAACEWCRAHQDPRKELYRWFRFHDFRPEPVDPISGQSMQLSITEAAMAGDHVLGILPTGTGKSICYQVPALSRYDKTGALTIVISPLVALMADQVKGMEDMGVKSAVTINGLLSMPERADALDKVRLGDAAILLISPEQLRSVSVDNALRQRDIGMWVLDEAHCLSKWGHDFRPDYRYVGRYIRTRSGSGRIPPTLCLTATAKPDVIAEVVDYFQNEIDVRLRVFDGGAQRTNLEFVVVQTTPAEKFDDVYRILEADLPADGSGGAIVYCATRQHAEHVAEFLQAKNIQADYFHAGLPPESKKDVQRRFIDGDTSVIVATNAFGMGIDKPDVRLVVHADMPGSLENYLQETGRAGRDQNRARCVLLYTQEDVERQFAMAARNRLTRQEIHGVLRALRQLDRKKRYSGLVVATTGEILHEDDERVFKRDAHTDDTRARTAIAWLEEAHLLAREANRVQIFPSSLRVGTLEKAKALLGRDDITENRRLSLLQITEALFNADKDEGISTDELMHASGMSSVEVQNALHDLEQIGIADNDTVLTAFVHYGVQRASHSRLEEAVALEEGIIQLMQEAAGDMEPGDAHPLHLRQLTQRLKDKGRSSALPDLVRRVIYSIAEDGRGEGSSGGSLTVRSIDRDTLLVTLRREWRVLGELAERRRDAARLLLNHLIKRLPPRARGADLLAETTQGKLLTAMRSDMILMGRTRNPVALLNRALLWLHEQEVIRLNKGLTVFRPAMTIRLQDEQRGFANADFEPLKIHYDQQTQQVHVMAEYVSRGLQQMADAIRLAMDYFALRRDEFIRRWLPDREQELVRQTTPESWSAIVETLSAAQRSVVVDNREKPNVLVLAGPGSGKTRVLVHRIAYLIRVRRENPHSILALSYSRHAAIEIRRRLRDLIGDDAKGVMVMTCHALAMRLTGASFVSKSARSEDIDFSGILREAIRLLRGDGLPPDDADEYRIRLLHGFRWILVDEYQDIERDQYDLISALAGRTLNDDEERLSLFAVGDDDQNIYTFNGASVEFIRKFKMDYRARPVYLIHNYRSTGNIIAAANAVIELSRDRMKADHAIQVDRRRRDEPSGGEWLQRDPVAKGRVQVLPAGDTPYAQAQSVVAELKRLSNLAPDWDWSKSAVIARQWRLMDPLRSLCELEGIPVQVANEDFSGLWRLRETQFIVSRLREMAGGIVTAADLRVMLVDLRPNRWTDLLEEAIGEFAMDNKDSAVPIAHAIEWIAEWSHGARRLQRGLMLLTAHGAKGLEFDHVAVLDEQWGKSNRDEDEDAQRRLYYVAMTRARKTLTLARFEHSPNPFLEALHGSASVRWREPTAALPPAPQELQRRYIRPSLRDVMLSFAGYRPSGHRIHQAIAALSVGDPLYLRPTSGGWELVDAQETTVGRMAKAFNPPHGMRCVSATVMAIVRWDRASSSPEYQQQMYSENWEVVVPELVFAPATQE